VWKIDWNSVNNDSSSAANRSQVYLLSMICYKYIMNLTTDGMVITNDIKFVQNSKEKLIISNKDEDKESKELAIMTIRN